MKANRAAWWEDYQPRLFSYFDPCSSFLTGATPRIRASDGSELIDVDESIELLLLGYGAVRQVGGKRLPSPAEWASVLASAAEAMRTHVPRFNIKAAVQRGDDRIESVKPFTYTVGSLEVMLLNDERVQNQLTGDSKLGSGAVSGLISLMWLDQGLQAIKREPLMALDYVLRARHVLGESLLNESRVELRREIAVAAAKRKLANDPKQHMMQEAQLLWKQNRTRFKSRAKLARFIQEKLPDLESEANLVRRMGEWEKLIKGEDS